jgi:hypothetical protein
MKAVVAALVIAWIGCAKATDPASGSGAPASTGSGPATVTGVAAAAPAAIAPAAERPAPTDAPAGDRAGSATSEAAAARLERLRVTLRAMDDLVTRLSSLPRATPHGEECKDIRELDRLSKALRAPEFVDTPPGRPGWRAELGLIDMTLEDIVDGRCGTRAMGRPEDFQSFYQELHRSLGKMMKCCDPP